MKEKENRRKPLSGRGARAVWKLPTIEERHINETEKKITQKSLLSCETDVKDENNGKWRASMWNEITRAKPIYSSCMKLLKLWSTEKTLFKMKLQHQCTNYLLSKEEEASIYISEKYRWRGYSVFGKLCSCMKKVISAAVWQRNSPSRKILRNREMKKRIRSRWRKWSSILKKSKWTLCSFRKNGGKRMEENLNENAKAA